MRTCVGGGTEPWVASLVMGTLPIPLSGELSPCVRGVSVQDLVGQPWKKNMSQAGAGCQLPRPRLWVQDARLLQLLLRLKALLLLPLSQELGEGVCAGSTQSGTFTPSYHLSRERPHLVSLASQLRTQRLGCIPSSHSWEEEEERDQSPLSVCKRREGLLSWREGPAWSSHKGLKVGSS